MFWTSTINNLNNFNTIEFERKFKNGLGGNNPNLDVVLENNDNILAIESKFLEPLKKKSGNFAESYFNTEDHRSNSKWYNLMKKINNNQINFNYLDAVQLLKHFYGICYEKNNKNKVLFYLYWEPEHLKNKSPYDVHRQEINKFSNFVKNDELLEFEVMTYQELWDYWKKDTNNKKLIGYIENLEKRYNISLSD